MSSEIKQTYHYWLVSYEYYNNTKQGSGNMTYGCTRNVFTKASNIYCKEHIKNTLNDLGHKDCDFVIMSISYLGETDNPEEMI